LALVSVDDDHLHSMKSPESVVKLDSCSIVDKAY